MPFNNPIVGALGTLIRNAIRSLNYVAGVSGWTINQDGTSEFSQVTIRGDFESGPLAGGHVTIINGETRFYNSAGALWLFLDPLGSGGTNIGQMHLYDRFTGNETATISSASVIANRVYQPSPDPTLADNSIFFAPQSGFAGQSVKMYNNILVGSFGMPAGLLGFAESTSVLAGTGATEVQDTGVGTIAVPGDATRMYRVFYRARAQTTATATSIQWRIRDGGAAAPTSASTLIAASQCTPSATGGAGDEMIVSQLVSFTTGTHTLGAFYVRTAGAGTVNPSQSLLREFYVEDMG